MVRDASGAAIQRAEVVVIQQGRHSVAITNREGEFAVAVPPVNTDASHGPRGIVAARQGRVVGREFGDDQNVLPLNRYCLMEATLARPLGRGVELLAAAESLLDADYDVARTPVRTVGPPVMIRTDIRVTTR